MKYEYEAVSSVMMTGKPKQSKKTLSPSNPMIHVHWPGLNPGLHGERLATNHLSHGMVKKKHKERKECHTMLQ
jgi:hypothetical protein